LPISTDKLTMLVVGCGRRQALSDYNPTRGETLLTADEVDLLTLDANPHVNPRVLCTLGRDPIPLADNSVDIGIAMHVFEHIGPAGDARAWFYTFEELYRVLKPGAMLQFECPYYSSLWAWADPTHVRAISEYSFLYLNQDAYTCGGSIPDFRPACDFVLTEWHLQPDSNPDVAAREVNGSHINGRLVARKPFNAYWLR
jgi:SAM-dependent methyltransferase